jgi:hypothetical protein
MVIYSFSTLFMAVLVVSNYKSKVGTMRNIVHSKSMNGKYS